MRLKCGGNRKTDTKWDDIFKRKCNLLFSASCSSKNVAWKQSHFKFKIQRFSTVYI